MKFKDKPNLLNLLEKEKKSQSIIDGVELRDTQNLNKKEKPWRLLSESVKDVTAFSFRIPKEEMMQIKYLSANKMISVNSLCLIALRQYLKQEIKKLEKD